MIQSTLTTQEVPRISANQLGEFVFATEKRRAAIIRNQKFGNLSSAPYYFCAEAAARRCFVNDRFSETMLREEAKKMALRPASTSRQRSKWINNTLALQRLAEVCEESNPPAGKHRLVRRNARFLLNGVLISVLPEIVTENLSEGFIAFTKLRFSTNKISEDASEIVLLALHHYGQTQGRTGLQFSFEKSKVVDCFSKAVIHGHSIGRHRDQQLHRALNDILYLWPRVSRDP